MKLTEDVWLPDIPDPSPDNDDVYDDDALAAFADIADKARAEQEQPPVTAAAVITFVNHNHTKTSAHPNAAGFLGGAKSGTEELTNVVAWSDKVGEEKFAPLLRKLNALNGVPKDVFPKTTVHWMVGPAPEPGLGGIFEPFGHGTAMKGKPPSDKPAITVWEGSGGQEYLNFVHEFAHRIDWKPTSHTGSIAKTEDYNRNVLNGFVSEGHGAHGPLRTALGDFLLAATYNEHFQNARYRMRFDPDFVTYMSRPTEVWARAYAQWATYKLNDPELTSSFTKFDDYNQGLMQWPKDMFQQQIAPTVEAVLRERGLLK